MEEEKITKQKPHTSFNRRLSVAKNPEGDMTTAEKNVKNFILQGEHDKGENMAKGITVLICTFHFLFLVIIFVCLPLEL